MKKLTFTDFDAFAASVREVDCEMMVQNPTTHEWSLNIAEAGAAEVQVGRLGTGNILEGKSWRDGVLVYLALTGETRYALNGETIDPGAFMVCEPDSHFDLSSNGAHDWCSIFVPRVYFGEGGWERPRSYVTRADAHCARLMKSLVDQVLVASENSQRFYTSRARTRAEYALGEMVAQILTLPAKESHLPKEIKSTAKLRAARAGV